MRFGQHTRAALSLYILISSIDAARCTHDDELEFNGIVESSDISKNCGYATSNILQSSSTSIALVCTKPGCVDAITSIIDKVPTCDLGTMTLETNLRAIARMCKDEQDASSAPETVKPAGFPPRTRDPTAECTEEQKAQAKKLSESEEYRNACGDTTAKPSSAADSPLCSRPQCMAYVHDTYIEKLPDCTFQGSSVKTTMKLALAVCEVSHKSVPEPSEASFVSISAFAAFIITGQIVVLV